MLGGRSTEEDCPLPNAMLVDGSSARGGAVKRGKDGGRLRVTDLILPDELALGMLGTRVLAECLSANAPLICPRPLGDIGREECPEGVRESLPSPAVRRVADIQLPSPLTTAAKDIGDAQAQAQGRGSASRDGASASPTRRTSPRRSSGLGNKRSYRASPLSTGRPIAATDAQDAADGEQPETPSKLPLRRKNKLI